MTNHYAQQREADDIWKNAPVDATHYNGMELSYYKVKGNSIWFYDDSQKTWLDSVYSRTEFLGHADTVARHEYKPKGSPIAQDALKGTDPVNHPKHYAIAPGVEAIDIIKASLTPEQFEGYLLGNFLKYRLRAGDKDDLQQDIAKSNWYRERLSR